jgi:hypothetical protein
MEGLDTLTMTITEVDITSWFGAKPNQVSNCRASTASLRWVKQFEHHSKHNPFTYGAVKIRSKAGVAHIAGAFFGMNKPQADCCHIHEPAQVYRCSFRRCVGLASARAAQLDHADKAAAKNFRRQCTTRVQLGIGCCSPDSQAACHPLQARHTLVTTYEDLTRQSTTYLPGTHTNRPGCAQ